MFEKRSISRSFNASAPVYDAYAGLQREVLEETASLAAGYFTGNTVLDAGCGTGAIAILPQAHRWNIFGVDIASAMAHYAKYKNGCMTVAGDMESLPFKASVFDGVIASLSLQWVQPARQAIREFARVLKPGGVAVCSTLGPETLQELRDAMERTGERNRVHGFESREQLQNYAVKAGLQCRNEQVTLKHTEERNLHALMNSLKQLGAANRREDRPRGLTKPHIFEGAEQYYRACYQTPRGLRVTWEIITLVLQKP